MEFYNVLASCRWFDDKKEFHNRFVFSKIFFSREKAEEYRELWLKNLDSQVDSTWKQRYYVDIEPIDADPRHDDLAIQELSEVNYEFNVEVTYYNGEYSVNSLNTTSYSLEKNFNIQIYRPGHIKFKFGLKGHPLDIKPMAKNMAWRVVESATLTNALDDIVWLVPSDKPNIDVKIISTTMEEFFKGNYRVEGGFKYQHGQDGKGDFV